MPKTPVISGKELLRYLEAYGCVTRFANGSHHKVLNPLNNKTTPVPIHGNKDLKNGIFKQVLRNLDIDIDEFIDFMNQ